MGLASSRRWRPASQALGRRAARQPGAEPQQQQQEAWAQVGFLADTLAELGTTIAHEAEDVARHARMIRARTATVGEMGGAQ